MVWNNITSNAYLQQQQQQQQQQKKIKKKNILTLYKNEPFLLIIKQTKLNRVILFEVNWVFFIQWF